jgi:nanoRNase/pAp phosphatase (c-di-AMP/oligoRNAs hydrolase)
MRQAQRRFQRLVETLSGARRILILTHDHPDPDALASGWSLRRLVRRRLEARADLAYGGLIGRAENRALVTYLRIPLLPIAQLDPARYDAVALVDTQPGTGNNSLPDGRLPEVIFDHHPLRRASREAPFCDVRPEVGALATVMLEYLHAADLEIDRRVATALFYAIRTETQNLGREGAAADARAFAELFPRVDNQLIARIEQAPFSRTYLKILDSAFRATRVYGRVAITRLETLPYPDVPAELADLLLRTDEIEAALVMGVHRSRLYLSLRLLEGQLNAGSVLRRIVGEEGRAGGHERIAGGRVDLRARRVSAATLQRRLARRAREALGVPGRRGRPLLGRSAAAPLPVTRPRGAGGEAAAHGGRRRPR